MQHVRVYSNNTISLDQQTKTIEDWIAITQQENPSWRVESINTAIAPESEDYYAVIVSTVIFNDEPYATIEGVSEIVVIAPPAEAEGIPTIATSLAAITGELTGIAESLSKIYHSGLTVETRRAD